MPMRLWRLTHTPYLALGLRPGPAWRAVDVAGASRGQLCF
jgi:hypothetical protein